MSNTKKIIAVAESSYIIRKGIAYTLSQLDIVGKIVELKDIDDIKYQLEINSPDAVIINPMFLGHTSRQDIRQQLNLVKNTIVIALVYNMIDEKLYRSYDGVIMINDSKAKINGVVMECLNKDQEKQTDQEELSDREIEILKSVVKGLSNKEIAEQHNISIHTAITHRRNITRKLKVHSVSGLTIYAIINNLIDISEIQYQNK